MKFSAILALAAANFVVGNAITDLNTVQAATQALQTAVEAYVKIDINAAALIVAAEKDVTNAFNTVIADVQAGEALVNAEAKQLVAGFKAVEAEIEVVAKDLQAKAKLLEQTLEADGKAAADFVQAELKTILAAADNFITVSSKKVSAAFVTELHILGYALDKTLQNLLTLL